MISRIGHEPLGVVGMKISFLLSILISTVLFVSLGLNTVVLAANPNIPVQVKTCVRCHSVDGSSANDDTNPKIAGLGSPYFLKSMSAYARGARHNDGSVLMLKGVPKNFSAADLAVIVSYFSREPTPQVTGQDPTLFARGQDIYQNGVNGGLFSCSFCHGYNGGTDGNVPRIAGQNISYQLAQYKAFIQQTRTDLDSEMMQKALAGLSDDDLKAVATYVNGLSGEPENEW